RISLSGGTAGTKLFSRERQFNGFAWGSAHQPRELSMQVPRRDRLASTLVDLLGVIAIIGGVVALLLPACECARGSSRRSQCANNIRQIGLGVANYESTHRAMPPGTYDSVFGSWLVRILPYVE